MPRKSVADTAVDQQTNNVVTENMNEENVKKEEIVQKVEVVKEEPLLNTDEIEVMSMVDNVTYKDSRTGDFYQWDKAGHKEYMSMETINNLWRNHKRYFRSMWLRPMDNRVIKKFGLSNMYDKYNYLMDGKNYVRENAKEIVEGISNLPNDVKRTVCDKVKSLIVNGDVTDVAVIRAIEKQFNIDLISYLD